MKALVNYSVKAVVDIAKLASDGKTGVKIPKGFVYTGASIKESVKATGGTSANATVKIGSTAIGSAQSIGGSALLDTYLTATAAKLADESEIVVTLGNGTSGAVATAGTLEIVVVGFCPDGDYSDAATTSAGDNVAVEDPYAPPEKAS